ncbi:MAG: hypothetical protein HRT89_07615, partial [Lentisphaeria bacterium]|nr:hypothetical protein [Lentisphaeria bacterium]NQZ67921.1 hypothetical protein [Lentisphaeria bacterium]
ILMSIVVHSFNGFTLIALSNAVSENTVSKHYYFFTIQISNTSGIIPVFPGGVGLRDVITQKILSSAKVDKINATMIPICFTLVFTFWSFIGALFFIFGKLKKPEDENTGENVIEE